MANTPTDESRSHMRKSQSQMRSWLTLDNREIHSCYWKSTSESILTNRYGTRRSRNGLVVSRATTYKWGMTVSESKPTLLQAITVPEVVGGSTLERTYQQRITSGDETTSELRKWQYRYPEKWQWAHLEKGRKAYPEERRQAIGDEKCTEHRADVKCTYKCSD